MNQYDGITWMGWIIIFVYFFGSILIGYLLFGSGVIFYIIALIVLIIYCAYRAIKDKPVQTKPEKVPYFTNEDYLYCKVGEWVSRK